MSPAAVVLIMPVATVALPRDSDPPSFVPLSSTSARDVAAADASYPVPSLPLHHARSCFRVYQRASPAGRPSSPPPGGFLTPPSASDNEVSDLLRGCVGVDVHQLDLLHHRRRRHRCLHRQLSVSCDRDGWCAVDDVEPWQCVPPLREDVDPDDRVDDDDDHLVQSPAVTVHAAASVMSAFYRPSLDFNKMQVGYTQNFIYNFIHHP